MNDNFMKTRMGAEINKTLENFFSTSTSKSVNIMISSNGGIVIFNAVTKEMFTASTMDEAMIITREQVERLIGG